MTKYEQRTARIDEFFAKYSPFLARQGVVLASWRWRAGRKRGPYYKLSFRLSGRRVSLYLGAEGLVVAGVRERLSQLQRPRREQRDVAELERDLRRGLRAERRHTVALLENIGLRMHGSASSPASRWR